MGGYLPDGNVSNFDRRVFGPVPEEASDRYRCAQALLRAELILDAVSREVGRLEVAVQKARNAERRRGLAYELGVRRKVQTIWQHRYEKAALDWRMDYGDSSARHAVSWGSAD